MAAYPQTTQVASFLQFCRDELDADPQLLPCDPASAGKMLAFLNAMVPSFHAEQIRVMGDQATVCDGLRGNIAEGMRAHMRGGAAPPAVVAVTEPDAA